MSLMMSNIADPIYKVSHFPINIILMLQNYHEKITKVIHFILL